MSWNQLLQLEKTYKLFIELNPEVKVPMLFDEIEKNRQNLIHQGVFNQRTSEQERYQPKRGGAGKGIIEKKRWRKEDFQFTECFR